MASAIEEFVSRLEPKLVGHARLRHRLTEEMRGHLEDAAERHRAQGLSAGEAQLRAIEDFGPAEVVAGAWAESKGVGVPTTFTRYSGLAGFIGALGLTASTIYESISVEYSHGAFAEVSLSFGALLVISLAGLYMRVRGKLVPYGRLGPRVAIAGFVLIIAGGLTWFAPLSVLGFIALFVGLGAYFVGAMRSGVIPRGPIALWIGGIVAQLLGGLVTMILGIDIGGGPLIGLGAFVIGWAWLGIHMWSEAGSDEQRDPAVG